MSLSHKYLNFKSVGIAGLEQAVDVRIVFCGFIGYTLFRSRCFATDLGLVAVGLCT